MKSILILILLTLSIYSLPSQAVKFKNAGSLPIDDVKILGVKIVGQEVKVVRQLLWDIGGFKQAASTLRQGNIDKFFTYSQSKDSYYIEFRYNPQGKVTKVKRMFRYISTQYNNRLTPINTRDVAREIAAQIGEPTKTVRKSWGAGPSYNSYIWESDNIIVVVDREGSDYYGNIFVEYKNKINPYERSSEATFAQR